MAIAHGEADVGAIIQRAQAGDAGALNELLAQARPRLFAVAVRLMRDPDEAEDVVQDALIKVCRYLDRFEGRSAFSTWLHRIVVNTSLDHLRRHQSRPDMTVSDDRDEADRRTPAHEPVEEETPERLYDRAETGAMVNHALARLSPPHRQVLHLREFDGESYQSIAKIARCPVGTIMSRLHHARRRLADQLAPSIPEPVLCAA